ncbi:MAG: aldo/keto reductase [Candidatus Hydrogenedentes bacterium]|nr:aldo/keto reductase [Candidatus Hydrogenedentota bacterium]
MRYRKLGASELNVSAISFGAWQIGDQAYWTSDTQSDQERTVFAALDAGINLFDTAEMYGAGESESALGRALGPRRDSVVIASKVLPENCSPEKLRRACEASLERLRTDRIDLYQIHWPFRDVPFEAAYGELARLREEGKIREIGVSNFGPQDLTAWFEAGDCVSDQVAYNLAFRAAEEAIVPWCMAHNVGVLIYAPLLQGILSCRWKTVEDIPQMRRRTRHFASSRPGVMHDGPGHEPLLLKLLDELDRLSGELGRAPATLALSWLMGRSGVTSVIVGARNVAQLERNLESADAPLPGWAVERLDAISAPLKTAMGPNPDMWREGSQARIR